MNPLLHGSPKEQTHTRPTRLRRILFGAPYYPEHWDESMWASDADRMAAAGFNVVRMAEFAWDRMEPRETEYDFSLFDRVIALMAERGIYTILCTPTATPPRWLTYRYPEVLRVLPDGRPCTHGSRQHACYAGETYRAHSRRITRAMARHFADNPHVVGWQTDNEINCAFCECICHSCEREFRLFLQARYGDIEALNDAWGTAFWAQTYGDWEEIGLPHASRPQSENPSARLDYYRYLSHIAVRFQREQVRELRAANPSWFVTHNGIFPHLDYWEFSRDLDMLGFDNYPAFTVNEAPSPAAGAAHIASRLDQARSYAGSFIVPEQQSGPGGQKHYLHDTPRPGEMRLWSYQSLAHGADGIMHFRWRTCRFGAEEYWCGILDHDSVPRRRYFEAQQEGREFAALADKLLGTHVRCDGAILHSPEQDDAHRTMPQGLPQPSQAAAALHQAFWMRKMAVGYVNPADTWAGLALLVVPHWLLGDAALADKLAAYASAGGTLLIGARTATKDVHNRVIAETPPGPLAALAGVTVEEYGMRPERHYRLILRQSPSSEGLGEREVTPALWYEVLRPAEGTEVLATWRGGHLDGLPAVTRRRHGRGQVLYLGTYLADETASWVADLCAEAAGLEPLVPGLPEAVEVTVRQAHDRTLYFVLNHDETTHELSGLPAGTELLSGAAIESDWSLEPKAVAIIEVRQA